MSISALIRRMAEAGASPEAIAIAVEAIEEEQAKIAQSRAKAAERKARQRQKVRDCPVNVTGQYRDMVSPKKEIPPTPPKEKTTPSTCSEANASSHPARGSDLSDFKSEFSADLDAERLEALVKHRRSKRGQLTGHSARLFRRDAEACGFSISQAVDTCISRNWITVKPEFLRGSTGARRVEPPPKPKSVGDIFLQDAREMGFLQHDDPGTSARLLDISDRRGQGPSLSVIGGTALKGQW